MSPQPLMSQQQLCILVIDMSDRSIILAVTVQHCSNDTSLTAILIFKQFGSFNTSTNTDEFVLQ